jgi:redox-sensing transcriptional repressor
MIIMPCEVFDCNTCEHYAAARCPGCQEGNAYLEKRGLEPCGIFKCTQEKGYATCRECHDASCEHSRGTDAICPLRAKFENRRWWAGRLARAICDKTKPAEEDSEKISDRTIGRMRWYLTALDLFMEQGIDSVSSWQLAQRVGVKAPLIRKDLSRFGEFGTPSLGYEVKYLRKKILDILKLNESRSVVWLGAKKLFEHLPEVERACRSNCHMVAVLDSDPEQVGRTIRDLEVMSVEKLSEVLAGGKIDVAVLALSSEEAQKAANAVIRAGVTAILNMSPSLLALPEHVTVRNIDIGGELLALSYYCAK